MCTQSGLGLAPNKHQLHGTCSGIYPTILAPLTSFQAIGVRMTLNSLVVRGQRARCVISLGEHLREACRDLCCPRPRTVQGQPPKASYHGEHLKGAARVLGSSHREHLKGAARVLAHLMENISRELLEY